MVIILFLGFHSSFSVTIIQKFYQNLALSIYNSINTQLSLNNILYILEDGRFGGMNKMTADIAKNVSAEGFQVHLLVGKADSKFFSEYLDRNQIPYHLINQQVLSKKIVSFLRYILLFLSDIVVLFRAIKKSEPDVVYCNGSQQIKGVIAATLAGKKVIWHMHDTYQPLPLLFAFHLIRFFCQVKWFVASCERTVAFYNLDKHTTLISRPPIDTSYFRSVRPSLVFDPENTVRVLTISNVNTDKGLDTLIRVAAELNKSGRSFIFTIVGLGNEDTNTTYLSINRLMESLDVKTVNFIGQKADIRSMLSETDLYLCTSRNESGPISVFEALSMGVPVISTDVGDLDKLFNKYQYGSVFPVDDHLALSRELITIAFEPRLLKSRIALGRELAEKELDISICVANQIRFYARVLSA
jgi:glycosyltransferase involved in cell wall biosynthesis